MEETEIQVIEGVPNEKVPEIVEQLKASERYVRHEVQEETETTSRIIVTVKKIEG
jgi:hypothetical protein